MILAVPVFLFIGFLLYFSAYAPAKIQTRCYSRKIKKRCPLCRHQLAAHEGIITEYKEGRLVFLGCPYCYKPKKQAGSNKLFLNTINHRDAENKENQ